MIFKYDKKVSIKLKRALPRKPNYCKLSVYSNALNYLGYKRKYGSELSPEKLLTKLNLARRREKRPLIDPQKDIVPSSDLDTFFLNTNLGKVQSLFGSRYINFDLWKKLIKEGFLLSPDHQELYSQPDFGEPLDYIDTKLLTKLINNKKFNYKYFREFYNQVIKFHGAIDEGHVDLVLDVIEEKGKRYVVFANLVSVNNHYFIKVPWNLFSKYLVIDWSLMKYIKSSSEFPPKKEFEYLRKYGYLPKNEFQFGYGMMEIFYKESQEKKLLKILDEFV